MHINACIAQLFCEHEKQQRTPCPPPYFCRFLPPSLPPTGPHGKTSLEGKPTGPGFMMRKDLEKKVDPASVKKHMCY